MAVDGATKRKIDTSLVVTDEAEALGVPDGSERSAAAASSLDGPDYAKAMAECAAKKRTKLGEAAPDSQLARVAPLSLGDA